MTTCQHKTVFWDEDEWRCRTCSQSLSFPARPPGPEDVKNQKRDTRIASGDKRRKHTPVVEVQEVQASPSAPLLLCHCCQKMLPQNDFYRNNHPAAANRNYRAPRCRGCTAFRLRVKRQLNPEGARQRDRARRERYTEALTPILRELDKQRRGAAGNAAENAAAQTRHRARQDGRGVPKQRPGRPSLHIKPICRIYRGCPLREFCTTSAKGLA